MTGSVSAEAGVGRECSRRGKKRLARLDCHIKALEYFSVAIVEVFKDC